MTMGRMIARVAGVGMLLGVLAGVPTAWAQKFIAPTAEELAMTSQGEVPGAPAVYLFREEITDDQLHVWSVYARIKVLNEKGKDFANVELRQYAGRDGDGFTVSDIAGRTIHPDGTIIPFTGKPYEKLIMKGQSMKVTAKVFTLPDVQVGSILEYRYAERYDDHWYRAPQWYVQSDLFTRKAHYLWKPTGKELITNDDRGQVSSAVAWTQMLPKGTTVKQTVLPGGGEGGTKLEVDVANIPPVPEEDFMPPMASLSDRVQFYYASYRTMAEYWKGEGKYWSKKTDKFVGPGPAVSAAVQGLVGAGDTQEQKLKKMYAAVMGLENTDFTREHSTLEDKVSGGMVKTTDDVWTRKRGSGDQLAALFVAMARAGGMKAYVMDVVDRNHRLFVQEWMSMAQFDDAIAIVNVDGKDRFFDPGQRYCEFGHLAWQHAQMGGLRQTDGGNTDLANTPGEPYSASRTSRVADLVMDRQGAVEGKVILTYTGSPALHWRQLALKGDETSLNQSLKESMERTLPKGMDVTVSSIAKLTEYDSPLTVQYAVKGELGSSTGKRMVLPADVFEVNSSAKFPHEKRELAVYFHYPEAVADAMRVKFPAGLAVESTPKPEKQMLKNLALYALNTEQTPTSITVRRNFTLGEVVFPPAEYGELRSFYTKMESKDQESVVLGAAGPAGASSAALGPAN